MFETKNYTPVQLALLNALVISSCGFITTLLFLKNIIFTILLSILLFGVSFLLTRFLVNKFLNRKIKLIYKFIHQTKASKREEFFKKTILPQQSLDEVGEDVLKMYTAGLINQHSIGFATIKSDWQDQEQTVRQIKEVRLYEGSAVLWGANPLTPTLAITKDYFTNEMHDTLTQRFEKLSSIAKKGTFTDKTFSLLEIEIKQIQSAIEELLTSPDRKKSVEPRNEILEALRQSNIKLSKFI